MGGFSDCLLSCVNAIVDCMSSCRVWCISGCIDAVSCCCCISPTPEASTSAIAGDDHSRRGRLFSFTTTSSTPNGQIQLQPSEPLAVPATTNESDDQPLQVLHEPSSSKPHHSSSIRRTPSASEPKQPPESLMVPAKPNETDGRSPRGEQQCIGPGVNVNGNRSAERAGGPDGMSQAAGFDYVHSLTMGRQATTRRSHRPLVPPAVPETMKEGSDHSSRAVHKATDANANTDRAFAPDDVSHAADDNSHQPMPTHSSTPRNPQNPVELPTKPIAQQVTSAITPQTTASEDAPQAVGTDSHLTSTIPRAPGGQTPLRQPEPTAGSTTTNEGDDRPLHVARESPGSNPHRSSTMRRAPTASEQRQRPEPPMPGKSNENKGDGHSPPVQEPSIGSNVYGPRHNTEQTDNPDGVPRATGSDSLRPLIMGRQPTARRPQQSPEPPAVPATTNEGSDHSSRAVQKATDANANADRALAPDAVPPAAGANSQQPLIARSSTVRKQEKSPELPSIPATTNPGDVHSPQSGQQVIDANTAQASASEATPQAASTNPHRSLATRRTPDGQSPLQRPEPPAGPTTTKEGDDRSVQVARDSPSSNSYHSSTMRRTPTPPIAGANSHRSLAAHLSTARKQKSPEHSNIPTTTNAGDDHSRRVGQQATDSNTGRVGQQAAVANVTQAPASEDVPQAAETNPHRSLTTRRTPSDQTPLQRPEPPAGPTTTKEGSTFHHSSAIRRMPTASEQRQPPESPMVPAKLNERDDRSPGVEQQSHGPNIHGNHITEQAGAPGGVPQASGSDPLRSSTIMMGRKPTAQRPQQPLEPPAVPATTKGGIDHSSRVAQQAANANANVERVPASDGAPSTTGNPSHHSLATRDSPTTRKPRQSPEPPALLATAHAGVDHSSRVGQRVANTSINAAQAPAADSIPQAAGANQHLPLARRNTPTTRKPRQPPEPSAVLEKPNADDGPTPRVRQQVPNANANPIQTSALDGVSQAASTNSHRALGPHNAPTAHQPRQPPELPDVPAKPNAGDDHSPRIGQRATDANAKPGQAPALDDTPQATGINSHRSLTSRGTPTARKPRQLPAEPPMTDVSQDPPPAVPTPPNPNDNANAEQGLRFLTTRSTPTARQQREASAVSTTTNTTDDPAARVAQHANNTPAPAPPDGYSYIAGHSPPGTVTQTHAG